MKIWSKIQSLLQSEHKLYLMSVVQSKGSAPGRTGFKMIVSDDSQLFGSIGGGVMEYNMVEKAKLLLEQNQIKHDVIQQVHNGSSSASSGMICSGSQCIAFNYLHPDDLPLVNSIQQTRQNIELSSNGVALIPANKESGFKQVSSDSWSYTESMNKKPVAHIFGAGHVSVPTSQLLTQVGFDVFLYDNRNNINTFESNNVVSSKRIIDYKKVLEEVVIDSADYILLMTHKFTEDKLLLSQFLTQKHQYLGVLGSDNKIMVMFDALRDLGFGQNNFAQVFAPIGLKINSQTTAEIAVSIVAEVLKIKNS
jgi:xanthine dehydrogenase accessory factor